MFQIYFTDKNNHSIVLCWHDGKQQIFQKIMLLLTSLLNRKTIKSADLETGNI